jgi:actin-related protein
VALAAQNIILVGGNASIPFFKERFESEIRPFLPDTISINVSLLLNCFCALIGIIYAQVYLPEDPIDFAWKGASRFSQSALSSGLFPEVSVSKAEYEEHGSNICRLRFTETF